MKLLAFSDIHLDAVTAGCSRRAEVLEFLARVSDISLAAGVDIVAFAGDAHDPGNLLDPLFTSDLLRVFGELSHLGGSPAVIAVAGNHDVVDTSELYDGSPVTTLTPLRASHLDRVRVFDRPHAAVVIPGWAVLGLPYISRAHAEVAAEWDRVAFEQARRLVKAGNRLIVIGHRTVPGAVFSSESVEMTRGRDQDFPFDHIQALKPALVLNGHYHKRQLIRNGDLTVAVPGSPIRFTFGEASEVSKGVMLVEVR